MQERKIVKNLYVKNLCAILQHFNEILKLFYTKTKIHLLGNKFPGKEVMCLFAVKGLILTAVVNHF